MRVSINGQRQKKIIFGTPDDRLQNLFKISAKN